MHGGQTLIIKPIDHPIDSTTDGLRRAEMGGADLAPPLGKRTSGLPTSALSRTEICFERQLIIRYLCDHRSATTTPVLIAHHLPLWVCDPRAGLEAADAPARCLIRSRVVGSALVLSSVSLFDLRPFLRPDLPGRSDAARSRGQGWPSLRWLSELRTRQATP